MNVYIVLIVFLVLLAFLFKKLKLVYKFYISPCYYNKPIKQQDFPQQFIEVNLEQYYNQIKTIAKINFNVNTIETILYESKSYPILSITSKQKQFLNTQKLLIFAGVHGNETGGVLAIIELLKHFNNNVNKYQNWDVKIVTAVNPVGVEKMSRYNECGCDVNRRISTSIQKGVVLQRKIVNSFNPNIVVSFHEAPSDGFLIHSNQFLKHSLLISVLNDLEEKGIQLSVKDYFGRKLKLKGNSKISGVLKLFNKIFKVDALGDYVTEKGIIEITTESSWNTKDNLQRVQSHVFLIASLLDHFKAEA